MKAFLKGCFKQGIFYARNICLTILTDIEWIDLLLSLNQKEKKKMTNASAPNFPQPAVDPSPILLVSIEASSAPHGVHAMLK